MKVKVWGVLGIVDIYSGGGVFFIYVVESNIWIYLGSGAGNGKMNQGWW